MARGYQIDEIKEKLIDILIDSKTGLSGVEISKKLGINRITITKYLSIFAAEGIIRQKNIGNVHLWFVEEGMEQLFFPDDYFKIKSKYSEYLIENSENQAYNLIRNCLYSNANIPKIMTEIIIPAIDSVQKLFEQGKIGAAEESFLKGIISKSIQILNLIHIESDPRKNVIVLSADSKTILLSDAASASFHSEGWNVFSLGDMSSAMDVLFDLELQKLLAKVWKQKKGVMVITVFSETPEGLKFFSEAINSVKKEFGKNLYLALCGKIGKKTNIDADLTSDKFETISQWSQTVFESSIN